MTELDDARHQIAALQAEVARLRAGVFVPSTSTVVQTPPEVQPLFDQAAETIAGYFRNIEIDPSRGLIGIGDERYLLVRASAFSIDFLDTVVKLYADRGHRDALAIGRGFLFDIAHTIGFHDARALHEKLGSRDPLEKLSGGPVHFAYTGWALVDIKPESNPVANEDFCLVYEHPYSFEAASFMRAGRASDGPACIMNAGYSSGWCEASFDVELTAVEVSCKARGDAVCRFVMAPPKHVAARAREHCGVDLGALGDKSFDVPLYFERKRAEEELRDSLRRLKEAQDELVRKERLATVGLLVSGVAHEVNTPLGVAVTAMSIVEDEIKKLEAQFASGQLTKKDLRGFLERSVQTSSMVSANLARAADQIANFKRVSVDQVNQERRDIDLSAYVQQTLDNLRPVIRRGALDVRFTGEPLALVTYPGAIAQIITNFITNSATHGRAAGSAGAPREPLHVTVDIRRHGSNVVLTYADDGRGMTEEVRARAFQPFFTTARREGGSGLGLHIIHSLVADVLRGRIDLRTAPGEGVRFAIEFAPAAVP